MGVERVSKASWALRDLRSGPLGFILDDFCDWLLERGFASVTVQRHLGSLCHLNRWLTEQGWEWSRPLSRKDVEECLEAYPGRCRNGGSSEKHLKRVGPSLSRFVEFLNYRDLFDPLPDLPVYEPLLKGYLTWMRDHQHAAQGTLERRRYCVNRFLESLGTKATSEGLARLSAERIESFFIEYAAPMGHSARRAMQSALRTFLRFCFYKGYIGCRLDHAVPTLRTYKLARVPRGLTEDQANTVLESVDRHTDTGRRDFAILTLLRTYGVRNGQIRTLRLQDIRWSQDEILFRATKHGKDSLLPLTAAVGESLLDYLQKARPPRAFPEVFLTSRAPHHPLAKSTSLSGIIRRHIDAAGLKLPSKGAHIFRHAFATRMVAQGHPFKAVADILGHRYLSTTFIYTKVAFKALSQVPLEWPEEVSS